MSAEAIAAVLEEVDAADAGVSAGPAPRRFCFVAGTHIATLRGEMPVEQLREGDHIRAKKGSFHTVIDVVVIDFDDLSPEAQAMVGVYQLKRGAIDEGIPRRDIFVSAGQEFELSRRLEIAHAVRMAVRKEGAALRGFRFVLFACPGLPMIRAEGVWTTLTPMERAFPVLQPDAREERPDAEPAPVAEAPRPRSAVPEARLPEAAPLAPAPPKPAQRLAAPPVPPPLTAPAPAAPSSADAAPLPESGARAAVATRRATRRPVTRFLRTPVSMPASPHTGTETPDP